MNKSRVKKLKGEFIAKTGKRPTVGQFRRYKKDYVQAKALKHLKSPKST